ncbi:KAP family P-loop NTPase fold protein [Microbulbifer epialgicus]|uniref:P-loop NTPase fold protein n=1 Tax=Microbulbifer epialgicus TaxID=393907 RepID=A0ABV4P123_9GAMM
MSETDVVEQETSSFPFRIKELDIANEEWRPDSDRLKRCEEVENLTPLLETVEAPLVFAIDSPWGGGKTTFIELWQKYLKEKTKSKACLHLNAWENDFAEDPLLPLLSCFDDWLSDKNNSFSSKVKDAWKKVKAFSPALIKSGVSIASRLATLNTLDLGKEYEKVIADAVGNSAETVVDEYQSKKTSLDLFTQNLNEVVSALPKGQQNLIIFIDELDRCRPTFAIELLERIKHLFNLKRVVFVIAVNREQLGKSIKGVYGNDFDGHSYLGRFFDIEYQLAEPNCSQYIEAATIKSGLNDFYSKLPARADLGYVEVILEWLCERFSYSLRDINKTVSRLTLIIKASSLYNHSEIELLIVMLFLRQQNENLYKRYLNGTCTPNEIAEYLLGDSIESIYKMSSPHSIATTIGTLINFEENADTYKECISFWEKQHVETDIIEMKGIIGIILDHAGSLRHGRHNPRLKETIAKRVALIQKLRMN